MRPMIRNHYSPGIAQVEKLLANQAMV